MIESDLIAPDALSRKYAKELHANEIVLLAYYIASINIENAYHATQGENTTYTPFKGICLTDTFQLGETDDDNWLYAPSLPQNSERVQAQQKSPIQVIISNPPYSVGQKSANDDAQNQSYPHLEQRIAATYVAGSTATNKNVLYDSYIKAFRWASDRLDKQQGGIIAFVSNGSWLDGNAMDGFRKCLEEEFSSIYVFNLRGNQRTSGETSRREGGKIFGSGSRTPIAITVLVKKPGHTGKAVIRYHDIGDYLSREEKLATIAEKRSILNSAMGWTPVRPNAQGDWLDQRNDIFGSFIPLGDKNNKDNKQTFFVPYYSRGLATGRDAWCYNFSQQKLQQNIQYTIQYYNSMVESDSDTPHLDATKISWTRAFQNDFQKKRIKAFVASAVRKAVYRPFCKQYLYFSAELNEMQYQIPKLFPSLKTKNFVICVSGISGTKQNTTFITKLIPDLNLLDAGTQCFPLYYYEKRSAYQPTLFDGEKSQYIRKEGITNFILERCRINYGPKVSKEDIFYYVYGLLHSPDYRRMFAADLKKMLPRLPLVERPSDFWEFSRAGRTLAELHLNYETQPPYQDVVVTGAEQGKFRVEKMRFPDKQDKTTIQYNPWITISHIPQEAYDYVVNGRSAVEWIMERYQIRTDKASGITNDPNDWADEHGKPRYILDLLLSVITVSVETVKIVNELPSLDVATKTAVDEKRS